MTSQIPNSSYLTLFQLKHFELHISVGEAISSAACGPLSRAISDTWNTLPERVETRELLEAVTPNIKWTLKTLMGSDYATSGNPSIRQVLIQYYILV